MAIETFNRYEKKYRVGEGMLRRLQRGISDHMQPDQYNRGHDTYPITNLYFDTDDNAMIRTSLAKPAYKEKLRLRAYGTPRPDSAVYVEIKKKVGGMVNKRRSAMKLPEAYAFLERGVMPEANPRLNMQVLNEIACLLERQDLKPALYLAYERKAYFGAGHNDLRVSFDTNIRVRRFDLRLESGVYGELLLREGEWLMEIKTARCIPLWLCKLLSENNVYPSGFSKYGFEYLRTLERRRGTGACPPGGGA
jgi:hypothetical protein